MSKFKVGDVVEYKYNLYSSVKFNIGDKFKVTGVASNGNLYLESIDNSGDPLGTYTTDQFEVVESNPVLTPEEVFEHLRKGTKLQYRRTASLKWAEYITGSRVSDNPTYKMITLGEWRIKPEPEVIELNGKKYREIVV